jgi:hypothetical protein
VRAKQDVSSGVCIQLWQLPLRGQRLARRSVAGALALGSWTAYAGLWQQTEREKSRSWLRRHGNGVPVRLGTGLRVLAVDLDPHTFNHFWCFAICLLVVVNEIAALSDPGA